MQVSRECLVGSSFCDTCFFLSTSVSIIYIIWSVLCKYNCNMVSYVHGISYVHVGEGNLIYQHLPCTHADILLFRDWWISNIIPTCVINLPITFYKLITICSKNICYISWPLHLFQGLPFLRAISTCWVGIGITKTHAESLWHFLLPSCDLTYRTWDKLRLRWMGES